MKKSFCQNERADKPIGQLRWHTLALQQGENIRIEQKAHLNPNSEAGGAADVAQVSQPAVSPVAQPADRRPFAASGICHAPPVWKPAIQQTWKSALRFAPVSPIPISEFRLKQRKPLFRWNWAWRVIWALFALMSLNLEFMLIVNKRDNPVCSPRICLQKQWKIVT